VLYRYTGIFTAKTEPLNMSDNSQMIVNVVLVVVLVACIWVGWSDYIIEKGEMSQQEIQEEIRNSIRHYIRYGIQVAIKYIIPVSILGYFIAKIKK
jgi:hypothetical protein